MDKFIEKVLSVIIHAHHLYMCVLGVALLLTFAAHVIAFYDLYLYLLLAMLAVAVIAKGIRLLLQEIQICRGTLWPEEEAQ